MVLDNKKWYALSVSGGKEIKTRDWLLENKSRSDVNDDIQENASQEKEKEEVLQSNINEIKKDVSKEKENVKQQNNNNKKNAKRKSESTPSRPEIAIWMVLLCIILIGLIFVIKTKIEQKEWDKKYKNIQNKNVSNNLENNNKAPQINP